MRKALRTVASLSVLWGTLCLAQTSPPAEGNDWKPASTNQAGRQCPQVNSEGRVRARIYAPQAQSVLLDIVMENGGISGPARGRGAR